MDELNKILDNRPKSYLYYHNEGSFIIHRKFSGLDYEKQKKLDLKNNIIIFSCGTQSNTHNYFRPIERKDLDNEVSKYSRYCKRCFQLS